MYSSKKTESTSVIRDFNDMILKSPSGAKSINTGSYTVDFPRMPNELVASPGGSTASYLTADPYNTPSFGEQSASGASYSGASGRSSASGVLRDNTEEWIKSWQGRSSTYSTSGLNNQAQHVVPFHLLHQSNVVKLFDVNTEHPHNSQLLPNKSAFDSEMSSVVSNWQSGSSGGISSFPSSTDFSSLTGSFHQGYHSAYNQGMDSAMGGILDELGAMNWGKATSEMAEAAVFHAQKGGRKYGQELYPLYRGFSKQSKMVLFPHFSSSESQELTRINSISNSKKANQELGGFISDTVMKRGDNF